MMCKQFSPVNLLNKRVCKLPILAKDNLLITNTVKTWSSLRKRFKENNPLNVLTTLMDNLEVSVEGTGPNFKTWLQAGIKRLCNLFDNGKFKTFFSP